MAAARPAGSWVLPALAAAATARAAWTVRHRVPGGAGRWERTNHRGRPVSMLAGPSWALGAGAGLLVAPQSARVRSALLLATAGAALFGAVDDLVESGSAKGLRGHLGELVAGRPSTGGLKVVGIGATGVVASALLLGAKTAGGAPDGGAPDGGTLGHAVDVVVAGGLVAGCANLANLLDLRPGRVLKLALLAAPAAQSSPAAAAAVGAAASLLGPDLSEEAMLGDCGANAVGSLLGAALVQASRGRAGGRRARAVGLAAVVALTLASERVSFTRVIESTPGLRGLDALGRARAPGS